MCRYIPLLKSILRVPWTYRSRMHTLMNKKRELAFIYWVLTTYEVLHTIWIYLIPRTFHEACIIVLILQMRKLMMQGVLTPWIVDSVSEERIIFTLKPWPFYCTICDCNLPNLYFFRLPPFYVNQFHGSLSSGVALILLYQDMWSLVKRYRSFNSYFSKGSFSS